MKRIVTTPLGLFGLFYLIGGTGLNIWMFIVQAWPTYRFFLSMFIGLAFVLLSIIKWNFKFSYYVQGAIGILPILILYTTIKINAPSDDIFLIPDGYRGKVIIIYGQENGTPEEYENDKRVYRIPNNGLLRTRFYIKGNSVKTGEHYFVDKDGKRTKIDLTIFGDTTDTTSVLVWGSSLGNATDTNSNKFHYQDFIVDRLNAEYPDDIFREIEKRENNAR